MDTGRFNLKSLLLGIGIGIIITSVISLIYLAGRTRSRALPRNR